MNNELSLEVSVALNPKVLRIYDTSHYYKDEVVDNYILEILPVNTTSWIPFNVKKGFSLAVNASSLRYKQVSDENDLIDLPDGVYEFKQSYKPNILTLQLFYHLRTVELSRKICREMSKLLDNKCNFSHAEYIKHRDTLRSIEEYILAAKWKVEEDADKKKGKELYEFAKKLSENYTHECRC